MRPQRLPMGVVPPPLPVILHRSRPHLRTKRLRRGQKVLAHPPKHLLRSQIRLQKIFRRRTCFQGWLRTKVLIEKPPQPPLIMSQLPLSLSQLRQLPPQLSPPLSPSRSLPLSLRLSPPLSPLPRLPLSPHQCLPLSLRLNPPPRLPLSPSLSPSPRLPLSLRLSLPPSPPLRLPLPAVRLTSRGRICDRSHKKLCLEWV